MGKGSAPSEQTVKQVNELPDYAKPYFENIMKRAEGASLEQYTPYGGQRLADSSNFADLTSSRNMVRDIAAYGSPYLDYGRQGIGQATGLTQEGIGATRDAMGLTGEALGTTRGALDIARQGVDATRMGMGYTQEGIDAARRGMGITEGAMDINRQAMDVAGTSLAGVGDVAQGLGSLRGDIRGASQYDPTQFSQYGYDPARQFSGSEVSQYMSPYMQAVVEQQKKGAIRDFNRMGSARDAAAVQAGAFGGSRQAVADYLAEEGLQQQLGDIESAGAQAAYDQAFRAFQSDRDAQMTRQDAMARELARTQDATESARQFAQGQRMSGLGAEADVLGAEAGAYGQMAGVGRDIAGYGSNLAGYGQNIAGLGGNVAGYGRDYSAFGGDLAARAGDISRLGGDIAGYGSQLSGYGGTLSGYGGTLADYGDRMAGYGADERATGIQNAQLLEGIGSQLMGEQQAGLDIGYQDFLEQRGWNWDQLGKLSNLLQGVPITANSTQTTQTPYNPVQQALGAGITGLSLYRGMT